MEDTVSKGFINKITAGTDPLNNGKAYKINTFMGGLNSTIVDLYHDVNYLQEYGREKFVVVNRDETTLQKYVWHELIGVPVTIEYAKPGEKPVNVL